MKKLRRIMYLKVARLMGRGKGNGSVPTIIAENSFIKGDVTFAGTLHVDGRVEGNVTCDELIVGVKGVVKGTIKAQSIYLYGFLDGEICVDSLFISKAARLVGDVCHNNIAIEPGAYITGRCFKDKPVIAVVDEKTSQEGLKAAE